MLLIMFFMNTYLSSPFFPRFYQVSLCAVFIGCALAASVVFFLLLDNFRRETEKKNKGFSMSLLLVTIKNLKDLNQILLIPLTIWSGIEQGFILSDYTKV